MTHDMPAAMANAVSSRVARRWRLAGALAGFGWQQIAVALALSLVFALSIIDSGVGFVPDGHAGDLAGIGEWLDALYGDDARFEVERMRVRHPCDAGDPL